MASNLAANLTDSATHFSFANGGGGASHRFFIPTRAMAITAMSMSVDTLSTNTGTATLSIFLDTVDAGAGYDLVFDPSANGNSGQVVHYSAPLILTASVVGSQITTPRVDIRVTTTADWSATTSDWVVWLEAEYL